MRSHACWVSALYLLTIAVAALACWAVALAFLLWAGMMPALRSAPAPLPRREVFLHLHPSQLHGTWRMGWNRSTSEDGCAFWCELHGDGSFVCGTIDPASIHRRWTYEGEWKLEENMVIIGERYIGTANAYTVYAIAIGDRTHRVPTGGFAGTVAWLQRPGKVTD